MRDLVRLIVWIVADLFRSRAAIEAEILTLRQQINVLRRTAPKKQTFSSIDRLIFVCLYRLLPGVRDALATVKPETVVKWHRAGFRLYWRCKSKARGGRPTVGAFAGIRITTVLHPAVLLALADGAGIQQHRDRPALQRPDRGPPLLHHQDREAFLRQERYCVAGFSDPERRTENLHGLFRVPEWSPPRSECTLPPRQHCRADRPRRTLLARNPGRGGQGRVHGLSHAGRRSRALRR